MDEIEALKSVGQALSTQDQESRDRILRWAVSKYGSDAVRLEGEA